MTETHSRHTLFLTATIAPRAGTHLLQRHDAADRLADYLAAFEMYAAMVARNPSWRIVLGENSGSDLAPFAAIAERAGIRDRCELVSHVAEENPRFNRLYLEAGLIRRTMALSRFLDDEAAIIWKITGRYRIPNLERVIARRPERFDVYLNIRTIPSDALDFYLAGFSRKGLVELLGRTWDRLHRMDTGEDVVLAAWKAGEFDDLVLVPRYTVTPQVRGHRGFDNRKYDDAQQTFKFYARVVANRLTPWLWI